MAKKKLTKSDIGLPTQFRHITHIGWDPKTGFDYENNGYNLKPFFERAGVTEPRLNDRARRKLIYDFIEENGVVRAEADRDASMPPTGLKCEDELKPLFARAGIHDSQLKDKMTREFIYKVTEKNKPPVPPCRPPKSRSCKAPAPQPPSTL